MSSEVKKLLESSLMCLDCANDECFPNEARVGEYLCSIAYSLIAIAQTLADVEFFEEEHEE